MKDIVTILIEEIEVLAFLGTLPLEKKKRQKITVDVKISYDAGKAIKTDDLTYALDYKKITDDIVSYVKDSRFNLMETLASQICGLVLHDRRVLTVEVAVFKYNTVDSIKRAGVVVMRNKGGK